MEGEREGVRKVTKGRRKEMGGREGSKEGTGQGQMSPKEALEEW